MNREELFYFAGKVLSLNVSGTCRDDVRAVLESESFSADVFISFCDRQLVLPPVYTALKKQELLSFFDGDLASHWAALYLQNRQRNLMAVSQLKELGRTLLQHGIQPVYLKGTGNLLDDIYKDVGERLIGDIDMLVREKDFIPAAEALKEIGYTEAEKYFADVHLAKHYPRLQKDGWHLAVEIHRLPVDQEYTRYLSAEQIFEEMKPVAGLDNCFVPGDRHKAMLNFIHAQLGNLGHLFMAGSLRDLYDMHLIAGRSDLCKTKIHEGIRFPWKVWCQLATFLFQPDRKLEYPGNKKEIMYFRIFNWQLRHPGAHRIFIFIVKMTDLFIIRPSNIIRGRTRYITWKHFFRNFLNPQFYSHWQFRFNNFFRNYMPW